MIYIYNSNVKYQKQIEYVFMNIFFILGLDYEFLNNGFNDKLKLEDILVIYTNEEGLCPFLDKFENIITIKPSNKLFCENYLRMNSIPEGIRKYNDSISIFSEDEDLYITETFNDTKIIKTNIDMISDVFFMLTRYEEVINTKACEKERYNRFPASESIAFKNDFLHRPIVNEHIELLWSFIDKLNLGYQRKKWWGDKGFAACITHDVDMIVKYRKFTDVIIPSASLLIKQKKPLKALKSFFSYFRGYKDDPYYTFENIINLEMSYRFKSSYYFMSGGNSKVDNFYNIYDKKAINLIQKVESRGFEAGYHCSFNSYNNYNMLIEEKEKLDNFISKKPYGCRQHYLRFQAPYTWRIQENLDLLYDTTLSFADAEGFRCGICFPFKPYDLLENRILNIWEIPLIVMEGSLQNKEYRNYTPKQGLEETIELINTVKKHNGVFTLLYHNSSFDPFNTLCDGWKSTYEGIMTYLYENNCLGTSGREIINIISE